MKIIFYIPAILTTVFFAWVGSSLGFSSISPMALVWIALYVVAGVLLSKRIFWGGLIGVLPGIYLMYMSTKDTGQVINIEKPLGVCLLIFYVLCSGVVFFKKIKK